MFQYVICICIFFSIFHKKLIHSICFDHIEKDYLLKQLQLQLIRYVKQ